MAPDSRLKVALIRFARVLAYAVLGAAIAALPELFASVPQEYQFVVAIISTSIIAALDKARRYVDPDQRY
jgi:hypothetical protein